MNPRFELISIALEYSTLLVAIGLPTYRIAVTGHFWPSVLRMWLYLVLWSALASLVIPAIVARAFHDKGVWAYFPDYGTIIVMICVGWIACLIFCLIAASLRKAWIYWRARSNQG